MAFSYNHFAKASSFGYCYTNTIYKLRSKYNICGREKTSCNSESAFIIFTHQFFIFTLYCIKLSLIFHIAVFPPPSTLSKQESMHKHMCQPLKTIQEKQYKNI